jgi:hypothetical protein
MNIKEDIIETLMVRDFPIDQGLVSKIQTNFFNALIVNGYYDILTQVISETISDERMVFLTLNDVEIGEILVIKRIEGVKKLLHDQKVKIIQIYRDGLKNQGVKVEVLTGYYKGKCLPLYVFELEKEK